MQLKPFDQSRNLAIAADVRRTGRRLEFTYGLSGGIGDVIVPPRLPGERTDGLWQSTCFEAFIGIGETSYVELNFAPSGQWAAYRFTSSRQGMSELDIAPPEISFVADRLLATLDFDAPSGAPINLAAVIEHKDGVRSYWALAHPTGNRPDFHERDCFVAKLP